MADPIPYDDPCAYYYDSDYPSSRDGGTNFDQVAHAQGIAYDIDRYEQLADGVASPILELGCGTGRVAIPLARKGHHVVGVDNSRAMLDPFQRKLDDEPSEVRERVRLENVNMVDLQDRTFDLVILAFNSLLFVGNERDQQAALKAAARHLSKSGTLAIDILNPPRYIVPEGVAEPRAQFARCNPHNGNPYTRFDCLSPLDNQGIQRIYGRYVEVDIEGDVSSQPFELTWRPIDEREVRDMLARAGLTVTAIEGGHRHEPFDATSSEQIFIRARLA